MRRVTAQPALRCAGGSGAAVTGAEVTGAEVTGAEVTGAEVTGAAVVVNEAALAFAVTSCVETHETPTAPVA